MIRTGIFAEYNRSEQTYCGLALADVLTAAGHDVRMLTNQHCGAVDPRWDQKVQTVKKHGPISWARGCDKLIFMSDQREVLDSARMVNSQAAIVHVPFLHRDHITRRLTVGAKGETVVYSSKKAFNLYHNSNLGMNEHWVNWASAMATTKRTWRKPQHVGDEVILAIWADATLLKRHDVEMVEVLRHLLGSHEGLHIYLTGCRPSGPVRRQIEQFSDFYGSRVCWSDNERGERDIVEVLHQADWLWIASQRQCTTWLCHLAMACDALPIVWNCEPFRDLVSELNGVVLDTNLLKAFKPIAEFDVTVVNQLVDILRPKNRESRPARDVAANHMSIAAEKFRMAWTALL